MAFGSPKIAYFEMVFDERARGKRASMSVFGPQWHAICGHRIDPGPAAALHNANDDITLVRAMLAVALMAFDLQKHRRTKFRAVSFKERGCFG